MVPKTIGILTAGGDSPGLNPAIRAIGKTAARAHDMQVVGFLDGFRGVMENRTVRLDGDMLSGILTRGGTILGTSRDKPHRMEVGGQVLDMTGAMIDNCRQLGIDALVCLGGGGTQKNAFRLSKAGMQIVTLPKTIDNDVARTERTFGFDTALSIATEAIDRLHSTAHSHHRIMVVEIMGHNTGWLALGAGIAGGADVVLIPEIPHDIGKVAESLLARKSSGSRFSIVAVSEGSLSAEGAATRAELRKKRAAAESPKEKSERTQALRAFEASRSDSTARLSRELQDLTGLESRVTILGHVQRGGTPSPVDRLLATRLGAEAVQAVADDDFGIMIASQRGEAVRVPLEEVAGKRRSVPLDHPWIQTARQLGMNLGD
ncbi:MAG: 6-phosphofructokinase [Acidimicrobiia bacterium]|nr:6-phosphofructokinase [Acidimicrobiia bacterium]MBT8193020.1 6-phosphofructokinase [Acidimicrobiia bacterium]NNF87633.1 6-phosphofructokinase [Acidimicrobiia bacterium]NNL12236.1 6-phosphofructokinase [Acidimicrobiia bacterium]NNL97150.1 6-phosphofructokinase [Acidimicrobiia bacterium]